MTLFYSNRLIRIKNYLKILMFFFYEYFHSINFDQNLLRDIIRITIIMHGFKEKKK